jgi:hypothetical protein
VRADISRLEGKVQALEPRRAGQGPNRTEVGQRARRQGMARLRRAQVRDRTALNRGARARAPDGLSAGSPGSGARALRRPPSRDRLAAQARPASEPSARSAAATAARGAGPAEPDPSRDGAANPSRKTAKAAPSSIRSRIRRPGANNLASRMERGARRPTPAAAGLGRDRFADLSALRRRSSDPRYASFRLVEAAPGRPSSFRSVRRSLRYRPIAECIP